MSFYSYYFRLQKYFPPTDFFFLFLFSFPSLRRREKNIKLACKFPILVTCCNVEYYVWGQGWEEKKGKSKNEKAREGKGKNEREGKGKEGK